MNSDCMVIGSESLDTLMNIHKMLGRTIVCSGNEKIQISSDASVTMIPSEHGLVAFGKVPFQGEISDLSPFPTKARDYRVGKVFTPEFEIMGKKFLHMGSAGFIKKELTGRKCDVVFLCVPGWKNKKNYPEEILELTEPDTVVLFHFDDFFIKYKKLKNKTKQLMFLDMNNMINRIKKFAPEVRIIIPELFETFEF